MFISTGIIELRFALTHVDPPTRKSIHVPDATQLIAQTSPLLLVGTSS
jgi:hypothetical protein